MIRHDHFRPGPTHRNTVLTCTAAYLNILGSGSGFFSQEHEEKQYRKQFTMLLGLGMTLNGGGTGLPGSIKVSHSSVRANFHSTSLTPWNSPGMCERNGTDCVVRLIYMLTCALCLYAIETIYNIGNSLSGAFSLIL